MSDQPDQPVQPEWIRHHEAAALMRAQGFCVHERRLRRTDEAGDYVHFPELERRREGKLVTMSRTQVLTWLANRVAQSQARMQPRPRPDAFADLKEEFARAGHPRVARALERIGY